VVEFRLLTGTRGQKAGSQPWASGFGLLWDLLGAIKKRETVLEISGDHERCSK